MTFEDAALQGLKDLDKDLKELREKVLKLEGTVAELEAKCEALQPFKPPVLKGPWAEKWGYK